MGFIDQLRAEGHAVESIIRVLREQGVQIAARTYRAWKQGRVTARTVADALVVDAIRDAAWTTDSHGRRRMTPEGLYGRRKMTALIRRAAIPDASWGAVDRAMRLLGLEGVRRSKGIRTTIPGKDSIRAGDLLNRDFTAPRPDHTWVMDFTYVRSWAGWVYVAFILDVFSQRIVAWHAQTTKHVDLVMIPLRMGLWERARQGHPIAPKQLRAHSDAQSIHIAGMDRETRARRHRPLDRVRRRRVRQRPDGDDQRALQDRVHPHHDLSRRPYKTITDVEFATAAWVDWYNHRRLHGSLGMVSPDEYEAGHYATLTREPQPA